MRNYFAGMLLAIAAFCLVISAMHRKASCSPALTPAIMASEQLEEIHAPDKNLLIPVDTPTVHSISAIALPSGELLAVWFGGSREGAADVTIRSSRFDGHAWSLPETVLSPDSVRHSSGHSIRKLGNPSLHLDTKGMLHLFVTSTSLGGWSTSTIEHFISLDAGRHFTFFKTIRLSPWLNLSHLVHAPAFNLQNGGFTLPAYFEMGRKYGVLLNFDHRGRITSRRRMAGPGHILQPWAVIHGGDHVDFYLRDAHGAKGMPGVVWKYSLNGARPAIPLALGNPDSGLAALGTSNKSIWMVRNPASRLYPRRTSLELNLIGTNHTLLKSIILEEGKPREEYSYPCIITDQAGFSHIFYTRLRKTLVHRIFVNKP